MGHNKNTSKYTIDIVSTEGRMIPQDGNVDVEVRFKTGQRYGATFFTIENIRQIMERYESTGECNQGQYFWASDMIIVQRIGEDVIRETINDLLRTGEFEQAFSSYPEEN